MIEDGGDKTIEFKSEENASIEIIESDNICRIVYTIDGEEYEYNRLKVYIKWKQENTTDEAGWLQVIQKGIAALYINQTVMYSRNQYGQNCRKIDLDL